MLQEKLKLIPHLPGSYQYLNKDGVIIYVGKAKDLHNRVNSYFNGNQTGKTLKLVEDIVDLTYIITNSELEAFILELNLIKKYNPKYNILLKDDKSYPYIEYIKKPFPMLKIVRYLKIKNKKGKVLFGPYPNVIAARRIVKLLNRLYPLKKCEGMPKEVCLFYHINECLGYCSKSIDYNKVENMEKDILEFLSGNEKLIKNKLIEKINYYSNNLNYEVAKELKEEMDYLSYILIKQRVEVLNINNADVINYYFDKGYLSIQILFIRNNKMVGSHNEILPIISDEKEDMEYYIGMYYLRHEIPSCIYVGKILDNNILSSLLKTKVVSVVKGEKKKLLDLAYKNAKINFNNNFILITKDETRTIKANEELKNILKLEKLNRIDVFDNSNLFGSATVSGMVVFIDGMPNKKEYRKYKITIDKNDDVAAMKEVIYRRYYRVLLEKTILPDLIIVDGGINQINACKEILNQLHLNILVCGLVKNEKHRTSDLLNGETYEILNIENNSNLFHFLTRIQDEVHRFTITYHRNLKTKEVIKSELDNVSGIGKKRKNDLIKKFKTINKMTEASISELTEIIPLNIAKELYNYLHNIK